MSQLEILEESVCIVLSDSIVWSFLYCFRLFMVVSKLYLQFWGCPLIWSKVLPLFSMDSYPVTLLQVLFFFPDLLMSTCFSRARSCSIENPRPGIHQTHGLHGLHGLHGPRHFHQGTRRIATKRRVHFAATGSRPWRPPVRCHVRGMPNVINYLRIAVPGANYQLLGSCIILYHLFGQMILFQFPTCPRFMWRWPNELGIDQNGYPPAN